MFKILHIPTGVVLEYCPFDTRDEAIKKLNQIEYNMTTNGLSIRIVEDRDNPISGYLRYFGAITEGAKYTEVATIKEFMVVEDEET